MYSLFIDLREEIQIVCTEMGKVWYFLLNLGRMDLLKHGILVVGMSRCQDTMGKGSSKCDLFAEMQYTTEVLFERYSLYIV